LDIFKGIANAQLGSGDTIFFGRYVEWSNNEKNYPELHSHAIDGQSSVKAMLRPNNLHSMFHLPLHVQAFEQYCELELFLQSLDILDAKDSWTYIWGGAQYSGCKAYNHLIGSQVIHPTFKWL
jgi:hypothetical protein